MGVVLLLRQLVRATTHERGRRRRRTTTAAKRRATEATPCARSASRSSGSPSCFGLYIVTHGQLTPGGGFQGGVVIATAWMLLYLAGDAATYCRLAPPRSFEAGRSARRRQLRAPRRRRARRRRAPFSPTSCRSGRRRRRCARAERSRSSASPSASRYRPASSCSSRTFVKEALAERKDSMIPGYVPVPRRASGCFLWGLYGIVTSRHFVHLVVCLAAPADVDVPAARRRRLSRRRHRAGLRADDARARVGRRSDRASAHAHRHRRRGDGDGAAPGDGRADVREARQRRSAKDRGCCADDGAELVTSRFPSRRRSLLRRSSAPPASTRRAASPTRSQSSSPPRSRPPASRSPGRRATRPIVYWFGGWQLRAGIPLGIAFVIDLVGAGFAAARGAARDRSRSSFRCASSTASARSFTSLILVFLAGVCGFCLTGDLFNLFVWFELMSTRGVRALRLQERRAGAAAGRHQLRRHQHRRRLLPRHRARARLRPHRRAQPGADCARARRSIADALVIVAFAFIATAFLVKAAIVPFHFWLADAHAVAPAPVCVLFSGIMVEVGVFGVMRVHATCSPTLLPLACAGCARCLARRRAAHRDRRRAHVVRAAPLEAPARVLDGEPHGHPRSPAGRSATPRAAAATLMYLVGHSAARHRSFFPPASCCTACATSTRSRCAAAAQASRASVSCSRSAGSGSPARRGTPSSAIPR